MALEKFLVWAIVTVAFAQVHKVDCSDTNNASQGAHSELEEKEELDAILYPRQPMKLRESSNNGGEIESRDRGREEIEEGEREIWFKFCLPFSWAYNATYSIVHLNSCWQLTTYANSP